MKYHMPSISRNLIAICNKIETDAKVSITREHNTKIIAIITITKVCLRNESSFVVLLIFGILKREIINLRTLKGKESHE